MLLIYRVSITFDNKSEGAQGKRCVNNSMQQQQLNKNNSFFSFSGFTHHSQGLMIFTGREG